MYKIFAWRFSAFYEQKLPIPIPQWFQIFEKFRHLTLRNGGKKTFKRSEQLKKSIKNCFAVAILHPFKIWEHLFHYFSAGIPKRIFFLDIGLWEVGAQRLLNALRKCDGQTNTQKFQLIKRIGPEGWFFVNTFIKTHRTAMIVRLKWSQWHRTIHD